MSDSPAMMQLSEIYKVSRTVDDQGGSSFADRLGEPWALAPGMLRFRRSSASHVFVTPGDAPGDARYLRAVPAHWRSRERLDAVARLAGRWHQGGGPVVPLLPSAAGGVIETVPTRWGDYHVMLVSGAPGEQLDATALTSPQASAWGAALAALHSCVREQPGLPSAFTRLSEASALFAADPPLAGAIAGLAARLTAQPADVASYGVVHGDFELDNLAWAGQVPTAFDFDDAQHSWFVDDIAQATRDLRPDGASAAPQAMLGHFIAGYRTVRPVSDDQLSELPLFAAARAADNLISLHDVPDAAGISDGPDWLPRLQSGVTGYLKRQRRIVLEFNRHGAGRPA
jgi:Ser/Thr protein kinase RdoA (MazF antagonist)